MTRLLSLSNELLQKIIDYVYPDDIENFLSSLAYLKILDANRLERHRTLQQKYGSYECGESAQSCTKLLIDLLKDPEIALYVKKLTIAGWHPVFDSPDPVNNHQQHPRCDEKTLQNIKKAASDFGVGYATEEWHKIIHTGNEDPIVALLLLRLSHLETLILESFGDSSQFVNAVLGECARPARSEETQSYVSRLSHVQVQCEETLYPKGIKNLIRFSRLNSVKSIHSWHLLTTDAMSCHMKPRSSQVSTLQFHHCTISP